jgi:hypothetical protein
MTGILFENKTKGTEKEIADRRCIAAKEEALINSYHSSTYWDWRQMKRLNSTKGKKQELTRSACHSRLINRQLLLMWMFFQSKESRKFFI